MNLYHVNCSKTSAFVFIFPGNCKKCFLTSYRQPSLTLVSTCSIIRSKLQRLPYSAEYTPSTSTTPKAAAAPTLLSTTATPLKFFLSQKSTWYGFEFDNSPPAGILSHDEICTSEGGVLGDILLQEEKDWIAQNIMTSKPNF